MSEAARTHPQAAEEALSAARQAVAMAREAGADDAVASVGRDRGVEFTWRDGRMENVKENASRGLSIALYVDGRFSSHSTNDLEPTRLKAFLEEAVALTRHLQPDPYRRITDPALYADRPEVDLDLVDPAIVAFPQASREEACRTLEEAARADERVISASSQVHDDYGISARATSNGFEGVAESTSLAYVAMVTLRDGETKRPEDHYYAVGTKMAGLPTPASIGAEALRRAQVRLGSKKASSRRTTMILHPEAGAMLVGRILGAMTAGSIQQRRSFLAEKQGQRIASPVLTLTDDPLLRHGLGSRHYDSEGISSHALPLVVDGVLQNFYVDTYYGRKLEWAPTTGSPSNIVVAHGEKDLEGLVKDVDDGLLVTSWIGGNANTTTGDFSFGVRGHLVEQGVRTEPVSEMNVTGNFLDLFSRLALLGNDPVPWYACRTPTMVFEDVQFSGT